MFRALLLTMFTIFLLLFNSEAQEFGRNKIQYKKTTWFYIKTPNFIIYYPDGYEHLMQFARLELEKGLDQLSSDFSYNIQNRIPVIIYPNSFDFQETNITPQILPEAVGGFTEILKNRVVVPFNGNWEEFRHVLVHELTHAFVFDFLYGNAPGGIFSMNRLFELPLWMAEGLSEFESQGWDPESDMFLRDAVVNNYVNPPDQLSGYLIYKEGQSLMHYIAQRWGRRKLGELFAKGHVEITQDRVVKSALGITTSKLYEDWLLWVRKRYYPQLEGREIVVEAAKQLTNHKRYGNYFNVQPAMNPKKPQIAFISDKRDYVDIYIMDIPTGIVRRIEKGERTQRAQSFHPMTSRLSFSPDGKYLIYSVKLGYCDGIAIYDLNRKKRVKTLSFEKYGVRQISSPAMSPDGEKIVFAGLAHGKRDIYITDTSGLSIRKLTNDIYDDNFPTFSADGALIAFSSDRPVENPSDSTEDKYPKEYGKYNIFILNLDKDTLIPLTTDGRDNMYPSFSPTGKKLAFVSSKNGVSNIYIADLDSNKIYPITNLISAASCPTWSGDGKKIAFSAFWNGGWDIYMIEKITPIDTELVTFKTAFELGPYAGLAERSDSADTNQTFSGQLSKFRFNEQEVDTSSPKKYTPQFSADIAMVDMGYSTYYGLLGSGLIMLSDVLGDHKILIATDLAGSAENSNFYLGYGYLPRRTDIYMSIFHYKNYFMEPDTDVFGDRFYGVTASAYYPLSQYTRVEAGATFFAVDRFYYTPPYRSIYSENLLFGAALVGDNSLWGYVGPVAGERKRISLEYIPEVGRNSLPHSAVEIDYRKYIHFGDNYSLALRLSGGHSWGKKPKIYYLGGTEEWINYHLAKKDFYSLSDIYINKLVVPLRGYDYFELEGNKYMLLNLEFRYPFVKYLDLGFPPITVSRLYGALFADLGAATYGSPRSIAFFRDGRLKDPKMGVGFGMRFWLWVFAFQYDIAWRCDMKHIYGKPRYYLSLGLEY